MMMMIFLLFQGEIIITLIIQKIQTIQTLFPQKVISQATQFLKVILKTKIQTILQTQTQIQIQIQTSKTCQIIQPNLPFLAIQKTMKMKENYLHFSYRVEFTCIN